MSNQQRWLSLEGICTSLQISRDHAVWLAKQGFLVVMWGEKGKKIKLARFLDPTPEYAQKLRLAEALYGRLYPLPKDIDLTALLNVAEVAQIMGWTYAYAQKYLNEKKAPCTKMGLYNMYSVEAVRKLLWNREGRKRAQKRAPILLEHLIRFFAAQYARENEVVPTDEEFAADDLLVRKLERMAKLPPAERAEAMHEFYEKVRLAKAVVTGD
jgi:hypothetical protein